MSEIIDIFTGKKILNSDVTPDIKVEGTHEKVTNTLCRDIQRRDIIYFFIEVSKICLTLSNIEQEPSEKDINTLMLYFLSIEGIKDSCYINDEIERRDGLIKQIFSIVGKYMDVPEEETNANPEEETSNNKNWRENKRIELIKKLFRKYGAKKNCFQPSST